MAAVIKIVVDSQGRGGGIADTKKDIADLGDVATKAGKGLGGFGDIAKSAFMAIGGLGIGAAIGGLQALGGAIMEGVSDAREAAKINAITEQVIKSMGNAAGVSAEHVADYAASLSAAAGQSLFGDSQIQEASNLLLTFGNIKGATLDTATALTVDLAQALGGEPQQQAMMLGKALNDPIAGIGALGKAGLTFSEEQKAMIQSLVETGDMAGAQNIIIAELQKQVGGAALAAAQADGGWAQFNDRMGEAKETIGAALLPVLNSLVSFLLDPIMPTIESVVNWFANLGQGGLALSGDLGFLGQVWTQLQEIISLAVQLIQATVIPIFTLIAGFIRDHSAEITAVLNAAWNVIKANITIALAVIKGVLQVALALFKGDWQGAWTAIKTMAQTVWEQIKVIFTNYLTIIKNLFILVWDGLKAYFQQTLDGLVGWVIQTLQGIVNAFNSFLGTARAAAGGVGDAIIQGMVDGIKDGVGQIISAAKAAAQAALDAAMSIFDSSSPSKEFMKIGFSGAQGMALGLSGGVPLVAGAGAYMAGSAMDGARAQTYNQQRSMSYSVVNNNYGPASEGLDFSTAQALAGV